METRRKAALAKSLNRLISLNQRLAKKYQCKISISTPGGPEVVLADGRKDQSK